MFATVFVQNKLKIDKILKVDFELLFATLNVSFDIAFAHFLWFFADYLNYMPNKVQNWKI